MNIEAHVSDAYPPHEIARMVERIGVAKARADVPSVRRRCRIAQAKADLPPSHAFVRGILCNALVCLAVWLATGARSVTDKILAVLFPITAFVAIGLGHDRELVLPAVRARSGMRRTRCRLPGAFGTLSP